MKLACWLPLVGFTWVLGTLPAQAQKEKRHDVAGFCFISGPKGERPQIAGLNAVFLFTQEQKEKLVLAREQTLGSEAVTVAGRKVKGDPNATEADRQAARKLSEEAQVQYDRRVGEILTPAQKELVQRLQVLYGQARETVAAEYAPRLVGAKGNASETMRLREESRHALTADFTRRIREILTSEQLTAFERAAEQEKQRSKTPGPKQ